MTLNYNFNIDSINNSITILQETNIVTNVIVSILLIIFVLSVNNFFKNKNKSKNKKNTPQNAQIDQNKTNSQLIKLYNT